MNAVTLETGQGLLLPETLGYVPDAIAPAEGSFEAEDAEAVRLFELMTGVIEARLLMADGARETAEAAEFTFREVCELCAEHRLFPWRAPGGDWARRTDRTNAEFGRGLHKRYVGRPVSLPSGKQVRFQCDARRTRRYSLQFVEGVGERHPGGEMEKLLGVLAAAARALPNAVASPKLRAEFRFQEVLRACKAGGAFERWTDGSPAGNSTLGKILTNFINRREFVLRDGSVAYWSHRGIATRGRRYVIEIAR